MLEGHRIPIGLRGKFSRETGALTWEKVFVLDLTSDNPSIVSTGSDVEIAVSIPPHIARVGPQTARGVDQPQTTPNSWGVRH